MIVGAFVLVEVTAVHTQLVVDDRHSVAPHQAGRVIAGAAVAPRVVKQFVVTLDLQAGQLSSRMSEIFWESQKDLVAEGLLKLLGAKIARDQFLSRVCELSSTLIIGTHSGPGTRVARGHPKSAAADAAGRSSNGRKQSSDKPGYRPAGYDHRERICGNR